MKKTRRFAAIAAAAMMTACMAVPMMTTFAADPPTVKITVESSKDTTAEKSTFSAYRILDASVSGENYSYTVNDTFRAILQDIVNGDAQTTPTDDEIKSYIDALDAGNEATENAAKVREFADAVYAAIKAENVAATATSTNGVFSDQQQGYYLIVETATETDDATDTFSLVMLDTAGDEELKVSTKEAAPSFQKKIMDVNDSDETLAAGDGVWRDSADYDIGDDVPFQLTATLPSDYASYKQYKLVFHDDLKLSEANAVVYSNPDNFVVYIDADQDGIKDEGETELTSGTDYTVSTTAANHTKPTYACDIEVTLSNLKANAATKDLNGGSRIVVEYTAELTEDAVIGDEGNWNGAYLEYSNNPYHEGTGDTTSYTPEDKVVAFTYQLDVNKVDGEGDALAGAGFTLYKWDADAEGGAKYVQVGQEITGVTTFNFKGVDAGKYKLVESTVPQGYTKAADLEFVVVATHTDGVDGPTLDTLTVNDTNGNTITGETATFTATPASGLISTNVENLSGSQLPSTGGIGTTIFYVVGGTMVAGAGVYLISKKRMKNNNQD